MTTPKDTGGPAFPTTEANYESVKWSYEGMTLRDYFAGQAMMMKFGTSGTSVSMDVMARDCYRMADQMLEARK
jgi:hypothetical protein